MAALDAVDFDIAAGEIHALLGENGAGKSTLMHVAYGLVRADAGEVLVDGTPRTIRSPRQARRLGVGMVHQHFTSVPAFTVEENIRLFGGDPRTCLAEGLDPSVRAETLTAGQKQRLEIAKALAGGERILLLDEPTAVLAPPEVVMLLAWITEFAAGGGSVVLITHKLDEAIAVAHRVTVLRRGRVTHAGKIRPGDGPLLARAMLGGPPPAGPPSPMPPSGTAGGAVAIEAQDLVLPARSDPGREAIRSANFTIHAGDLVGIAAVEGSGQRELLLALAGLHPPGRGHLRVVEPAALIPEDRTTEGLIPTMTLAENVTLGLGARAPWIRRGQWIDWRAARHRTAELLREFDVLAPGGSPQALAATLSGGNQQKLVLARALERHPRVLVAENPTRGLDFHAAATLHRRFREIAATGVAIVFYSADLDEVLSLAGRILVLARGHLAEAPPLADRDLVGRMMLGVVEEHGER